MAYLASEQKKDTQNLGLDDWDGSVTFVLRNLI